MCGIKSVYTKTIAIIVGINGMIIHSTAIPLLDFHDVCLAVMDMVCLTWRMDWSPILPQHRM
jgi:hypothetical protein